MHPIESERLRLRAIEPDRDAAPMLALLNDPGFVRFIGDRNVRSEEQAREYIALRVLHSYALNGFGMYAIERLSDGAWLGNAGLVRRDGLPGPDIGYAVLSEFAGQGYAGEAARAVFAHARAELGLQDLYGITDLDNVVSGKIRDEELRKILKATGCYSIQIHAIEEALEAVVREDPVHRVVIHLDQRSPPVAFQPYFPRVVPIYNHLQTAIVLFLDGTLPVAAIQHVARDLLGHYGFDQQRLTNLAEDIMRRRRVYHDRDALSKLAVALRELPEYPPREDEAAERLDEATNRIVASIAERADHLSTRPFVDDAQTAPRSDYLELWAMERERQEEARRAKKLAEKISRDQERAAAAAAKARSRT